MTPAEFVFSTGLAEGSVISCPGKVKIQVIGGHVRTADPKIATYLESTGLVTKVADPSKLKLPTSPVRGTNSLGVSRTRLATPGAGEDPTTISPAQLLSRIGSTAQVPQAAASVSTK